MSCNAERWCVARGQSLCPFDAAEDGPDPLPDGSDDAAEGADLGIGAPADAGTPDQAAVDEATGTAARDAAVDAPPDAEEPHEAGPPDVPVEPRDAAAVEAPPPLPPEEPGGVPAGVLREGVDAPDVFYVDPNGVVFHRGPTCGDHPKGSLPFDDPTYPHAVGIPAVTSWGKERMDLFVRTQEDKRVWQLTYDNNCWLGSWVYIGGPDLSSDPAAVSPARFQIDLFARGGSKGDLVHIRYKNAQFDPDWESLGGALASAPAAVSIGPGVIDVFSLDASRRVQRLRANNDQWMSWESLQGEFVYGPAVAVRGEGAELYATDVAYRLWHMRVDRTGHTPWEIVVPNLTLPPGPFQAVATGPRDIQLLARTAGGAIWTQTLTYP